MAEAVGISPSSVGRIWAEAGLKPHLTRGFKVSNDPMFEDARKQAGLNVSDRIVLGVSGSPAVEDALGRFRDYLMSETLAVEWKTGQREALLREARSLDQHTWNIEISKAVHQTGTLAEDSIH